MICNTTGVLPRGTNRESMEHVHQSQGAVLRAGRNGRAGQDGAVDRRDECRLIPDFEDLIDIQCRKADVAFDPELVGIEAAFEIAENGFDVSRLGIHHGQYQKANVLAGGGDQKTAPILGL